MKIRFFSSLPLLILLCLTNFALAQKTQTVSDPANDADYQSPAAEIDFVKRVILAKAVNSWTENSCTENLRIAGRAEGSFIKANSKQTAYLFEYCITGNGLANDGILITENEKPVALYTFEGGEIFGFSKLADINQNKTDEMVVEWSGGMHSGEIGSVTLVLEVASGNLKELAIFQSSWSVCDGDISTIKCGHAYKITADAAPIPTFYQLKMVGEGKKWRVIGKAQKAKTIKTDVEYKKVNL